MLRCRHSLLLAIALDDKTTNLNKVFTGVALQLTHLMQNFLYACACLLTFSSGVIFARFPLPFSVPLRSCKYVTPE